MLCAIHSLLLSIALAAPGAATPLVLPADVDRRNELEREIEAELRDSVRSKLFARALWLVEMRVSLRPSVELIDLRDRLHGVVRDRTPLTIARHGARPDVRAGTRSWTVEVGERRWATEISLVERVDLADYRPSDDATALHPAQVAAQRRVDDLLADIEALLAKWQNADELEREHLRFRMDLLERELARAAEQANDSALDERVVRWEKIEVRRASARVRAILAAPVAVVRDDGVVVSRRSVKVSREFDIPWNRHRDAAKTDPRTLVGPVRSALEEELEDRLSMEKTKLVEESLETMVQELVRGPTTPERVDRAISLLAHEVAEDIRSRELLVGFVERADARSLARHSLTAVIARH